GSMFLLIPQVFASSLMWSQNYGGPKGEYARSLIATSDGGYAIAGWTDSYGAGEEDFWLVKTDANGNIQWNKTYGGTGRDEAQSVIQTSDEGYAIVGYTFSFGAGNYDFWLIKTDANGIMQWNKTFGGQATDIAYSLVETSDGDLVLTGQTISVGAESSDFWLIKTDMLGNLQWDQTFGGLSTEEAYSVIETNDGGLMIAGFTNSFGSGNYDYWLVKTDSNGEMMWNQTYGGPNWDEARSIIQSNDGGYAIAGMTASFGAGSNDFWLVKIDVNGNVEWNQTYGTESYEKAYSLIQTNEGGFALAGYVSYSVFENDFLLVKTDEFGNMQWNQTYGGEDWQIAYSLVETSDGGYALAGETLPSSGTVDFWLIKTDENGIISEFSSTTILALVLSTVLGVLIFRKKLVRSSKK
ncbi:MAG: hypothetical protein P8Y18_07985, partial [Candidatus Bathyarchaeota archaeon]